MVAGELNAGIDDLGWWTVLSGGIAKGVAGGGINNGEGRGKVLAGDLVEEAELNMETSDRIKLFCGNNWVTGVGRVLWQ